VDSNRGSGGSRSSGLAYPVRNMSTDIAKDLERILARQERPFIAYEHLREAYRSSDFRFAWIQAAAAAELGIKEALLRLEPRLDPLLLEVPAPPVEKLYGRILEHYGGEKSPFAGGLQKGAARRNRIIHQPRPAKISSDDRNDYLATVSRALRHLVILCRRKVYGDPV